ncbi:MAG: DNA ligase D, partial [Pelobium sp.]
AKHQEKEEFTYQPMLAKLASSVFDDQEWIYERKIDGYRIIAHLDKKPKLVSRNNLDYTENFASISKELGVIKKQAVLDGEVVAENKDGIQKFQLLQHYENGDTAINLKYYVFDLLSLDGHDLTELPLLQRKKLLAQLLLKYPSENIIFNKHILGEGQKLFKKAKNENWEGIIGKRASDEYYGGKRSDSWLKFKLVNSQEAIICGYTKPAGSRNYFGALVLGINDKNNTIKYIGNCGTGFNDQSLKELYEKLGAMILVKKPVIGKVNQEKNVTWVRPELVCEVNFTEWTEDKHLRHPVFKGLRDDKNQDEIIKETSDELPIAEEVKEKELSFNGKKVKLSNLTKLYWDKEGYTKGDLIQYYDNVSSYMLPYLKDKPLSLNRHPNGAYQEGFYQKDVDISHLPSWAKTAQIHSESNNKEIDYLICNDKASLIYMANLGCIEINPWLSTYKKPENPEFLVIDLDPDGNPFKEVVKVALKVREVLESMKITSFVKTSGSTGLHIFIYVATKYDYDFVKDFASFIAHKTHELIPGITSIERSPSKRKGLIYIDFLQNRRGQTIAAPFSARPKPGATVSMPLSWDKVNEDLDMNEYTIFTVPEILGNRDDPWKDIKKVKLDIKKALSHLG